MSESKKSENSMIKDALSIVVKVDQAEGILNQIIEKHGRLAEKKQAYIDLKSQVSKAFDDETAQEYTKVINKAIENLDEIHQSLNDTFSNMKKALSTFEEARGKFKRTTEELKKETESALGQ